MDYSLHNRACPLLFQATSHDVYGLSSAKTQTGPSEFSVRKDANIAPGMHNTTGIDLGVSTDRVILLDTQPVFSSSVLLELLSCPSPCMEIARTLSVAAARGARPAQASAEAIQMIMGLQTAIFLCGVCHMVIVLCDGPDDSRMWELLELAGMLVPKVLMSVSTQGFSVHTTQLEESLRSVGSVVFVHNNMSKLDMSLQRVRVLEETLQGYMSNSIFCGKGAIKPSLGSPFNQMTPTRKHVSGKEKEAVGFYVLPKLSGARANSDSIGEDCISLYNVLYSQLHKQIMKHRSRQQSQGFSERDWLLWSERVWDSAMKSRDVAEYFFRIQLTTCRDGGGW